MTDYVESDHAHDLVIRRPTTGVLVIINDTPFRWISKLQKTVETSTYGSESVLSRFPTDLILQVRYMLRSLEVSLNGSTLILGDNTSVVLNARVSSRVLKKNHDEISYH
jgi:hypothetical protein